MCSKYIFGMLVATRLVVVEDLAVMVLPVLLVVLVVVVFVLFLLLLLFLVGVA